MSKKFKMKFNTNLNNFVLALSAMASSMVSHAATVTKVDKEKKIIYIDEGIASGFIKGSKVCFKNESAKSLGCATISNANPSKSMVQIKSDKVLDKIPVGTNVELKEKNEQIISVDKSDNRYNIKAFYLFTFPSPTTYNNVSYLAPETVNSTDVKTLWTNEEEINKSLFSGGGEVEFGIGRSMSLAIGGKMRSYTALKATSDYNLDITLANKAVKVEQSGTSFGTYFDLYFVNSNIIGDNVFFKLGSGLDFDISTVSLKAKLNDIDSGESEELASYKSSKNIVSLRIPMQVLFTIGKFGMVTPGVNLIVPVAEAGGSATATVNDPQESMLSDQSSDAAKKDLISAVNHQKNSFAAEIMMGVLLVF